MAVIGLNCPIGPLTRMATRMLESAGFRLAGRVDRPLSSGDVVLIDGSAHAQTLRATGAVIVHVETAHKPWYPDHVGPGRVPVEVGDVVLCGMRPVADVLAELVAVCSREAA